MYFERNIDIELQIWKNAASRKPLLLRGVRPFLSDKYDITAHPNYKYLSDSNPKNAFHIEKYLSRQLKLRLEEESMAYEIDVSEDDEMILDELTDDTQLVNSYNELM